MIKLEKRLSLLKIIYKLKFIINLYNKVYSNH